MSNYRKKRADYPTIKLPAETWASSFYLLAGQATQERRHNTKL